MQAPRTRSGWQSDGNEREYIVLLKKIIKKKKKSVLFQFLHKFHAIPIKCKKEEKRSDCSITDVTPRPTGGGSLKREVTGEESQL